MNEAKYILGFNNGYIMAEHKPDLAESLSTLTPTANEYMAGLKDGKEQLEFEKTKEQLNELDGLRNRDLGKVWELGRSD